MANPVVPPALTLQGADVLWPQGLFPGDVHLAEGMITDMPGRMIDLSGFLILPGIIDLHGDGFERHLAPRRGAMTDTATGLRALEAELAANGITTAWLAQFWSWEGGMRSPEFARHIVSALDAFDNMLDLRMQLRLEVGCFEGFPKAETLVAEGNIGYVVFNDHLPHAHLSRGKTPPRLEGQALKSGRSPRAHWDVMRRLHDAWPEAAAAVAEMAARLQARNVVLGSHDDADTAARAHWREAGVRVAEFPMDSAAIQAAAKAGDTVVMGAPNILRGGSHGKGIAAAPEVAAGRVTALASDYHYPAPLQAALGIAGVDRTMLVQAWYLVSGGPAKVMGLNGDRGGIAPGMRADLVILEAATNRVAGTLAGGCFTYLTDPLASRMIAA
ncbi:MAG: alpha-D-ribose 1-methylphosphonate 5-triphosphate diphosphatase [Rhodobacteraceae bacterium]|nr:alpha-D-ribose 1-methylphosphonate 5-triphosphate diphosphatase [Paracoccaceae bacterium]